MMTFAPTRRARSVMACVRSHRSSGRPNGGAIACHVDAVRAGHSAPRLRRDVNVVAARGEAFGHRLHVNRPAERARHRLVERRIENAHGIGQARFGLVSIGAPLAASARGRPASCVLRSNAKKGPDWNRPKSSTSTHHDRRDDDAARDMSSRPGGHAPAPRIGPLAPRRPVSARPTTFCGWRGAPVAARRCARGRSRRTLR